MKISLHRHDPAREYWFDEGCFINELANDAEDSALSIALARVLPGATTRWHLLEGIAERYVIQQGKGVVEVGDAPPRPVGKNDVVLIPSGCRQRITNTGSEDLVFLALCTPRFQPQTYRDLE
ncbi:MAG TPA: cupin domain-containing protein [Hyphomicrobiales bacterium]|nr:cupin domain-containing protein [Hyphomicrobiales bacterium]